MADRLQQAITVLQTRFGSAAPRPAAPPCPARSSGIPELDALTGIGGWPVGRVGLLGGPRGAGERTAVKRSPPPPSREGPVAYVDIPGRLDPEFLSHFDARLDHLLVVRPKSIKETMASVRVLGRACVDFIAIDPPPARSSGLDAELPHLLHRAAEADCTLLLIHDADAEDAIRYYASLILSFERSAWIFRRDGDLEGLQVDAAVVKNRLAPPGLKKQWIVPYPIP